MSLDNLSPVNLKSHDPFSDERADGNWETAAESLSLDLPVEVWQVGFVTSNVRDPQIFGRAFGEQQQHQIVRLRQITTEVLHLAELDAVPLSVVIVPPELEVSLDVVQEIQKWLDAVFGGASRNRSQLISLQGSQLVWHPRCIVVLAPAERVVGVCQATLEAYFFEAELRTLESGIEAGWDATLADAPLSFEFNSEAIPRREDLSTRFQEVLRLRTRYARLMSNVIVPHMYPPTLASQIGERFRERLRMEERLELVDEKLAVQEHVYELCSQRTSDFMVARTGHHLEWAIIILLAFQTLMWMVDLLSASAS